MLATGFILGLLGSLHCIGMCGPIAFMLPVDRSNSLNKISQIFTYHLGRIISYALIGVSFGLAGKSLYLFGLQQQLSIIVGVIMILLVVIPYRVLSTYNVSRPVFKIISKIKSRLGKTLKKKSADAFITIGFLNGFLPCGLVYIAVFGSLATADVVLGGLYMTLFGIGTIPLMTAAIYLGKFLNANIKQHIQKAIPVFVVIIGLLFILRGLGLGIPYLSPAPSFDAISSSIECQ